ncbi:plus-3-domain-containing protein [Mycena alexandri]|uniref:Plus-3-domain-containing protein n=1 Tax=Mycena alexandri TaxID=1745969 RepID=A0AAD6SMV2_9AGAR|nr:plus-3-domain-containing protein [Mycena alexandri]
MGSEFDDELLELIGGDSDSKQPGGGAVSSRKRNRDSGGGGKGSGSAGAGKTSKKRKLADSDNEPESEEGGAGAGAEEPGERYPLEGKYIDEEDRETLLAKTDLEREEILTARMDEMERIRDRKHVDRLRAQQLAGVAGVDREGGESGSKRAPRATGKDKTKDKTLTALKAKRKAKDEKKRTRASTPKTREGRSSSPMDMEMSDPSDESDDEDGQISRLDQEDEKLKPPSSSTAHAHAHANANANANDPLTSEYLQKIMLTRDMLAKHAVSPFFEGIVRGCWVRYLIGNEGPKRVYRICQIKALAPAPKPYKLTPDNAKLVHHVFELKHGKAEKVWGMDRASNEVWSADEFKRLVETCAQEEVALPTRREVDERCAEMQELLRRVVTEDDITAMIARKRALLSSASASNANANSPSTPQLSVAERSRLTAERTLAMRRQEWGEVRRVEAKSKEAGAVQQPADRRAAEPDLLAKVNERNRKANAEAVRKMEAAEAERKRRERKLAKTQQGQGGEGVDMRILDPSARLRTVPRVWESATPGSRCVSGTPNPATLGTGGGTPKKGASPAPPSKLAMNATAFETKIIESIEVDLGDF